MDFTSIIVAIVALCGSLGGALLANRKMSALVVYRLGELEKKVDNLGRNEERIEALEKSDAVTKEQIKVANHRIDDLERKVGA